MARIRIAARAPGMAARQRALVRIAGLAVLVVLGAPVLASDTVNPEALAHLVKQDCGSCHGLTLKGGLGPDIRPEAVAHYDAETLAVVVLDGIPGTAMPPWRPLMSEAEAAWVAEFLLKGETP